MITIKESVRDVEILQVCCEMVKDENNFRSTVLVSLQRQVHHYNNVAKYYHDDDLVCLCIA